MGIQLEIIKDGVTHIKLTNHSIDTILFDSIKPTDDDDDDKFRPRLHGITKELIIKGRINTDLQDQKPVPLLDDYEEPILDEYGDLQYELLEFDAVRQLANWAIIPEYLDPYSDLSVKIIDARGDIVKTTEYEDMFVFDYQEGFNDVHGNGWFIVHMREHY